MAAAAEKKSLPKKMANYFREVKSELKKVIWPAFPKVAKNTGIVIVAIIISSLVIFAFDSVFGLIFQNLLGM